MPLSDFFGWRKSTVVSVPCPYCGDNFGLPANLRDSGPVDCPYCQQTSMRKPCGKCQKPIVFAPPASGFGEIRCPHCNACEALMNVGAMKRAFRATLEPTPISRTRTPDRYSKSTYHLSGHCRELWADPNAHSFSYYRLMQSGMMYKCGDCSLGFICPRDSKSFPSQYRRITSRSEYGRRYPGFSDPTYFEWIDPAKGEESFAPITTHIERSRYWTDMGFDPDFEPRDKAYFEAAYDYSRNRGRVLGEDDYRIVCVSPTQMLGMEKQDLASKVHPIDSFEDYLQIVKYFVDQNFPSNQHDRYLQHHTHEMRTLLQESGAKEAVSKINREFHLAGPDPTDSGSLSR